MAAAGWEKARQENARNVHVGIVWKTDFLDYFSIKKVAELENV